LRSISRRPRRFSDRGKGLVTLRAGELLFHLCQGCSNDIVMMHMWADGLDGVEPQAVD
jgi:hypothetical protein